MKALFLGGVAASTAAGIAARLPAGLDVEILDDPIDRVRLPQAAADADILVSNHWRADYPRRRRSALQSVRPGHLISSRPCRAGSRSATFGHECDRQYVVMVMLAWRHHSRFRRVP